VRKEENYSPCFARCPFSCCYVENDRGGGNDRRRGFYTAELRGASGGAEFVLSGGGVHE